MAERSTFDGSLPEKHRRVTGHTTVRVNDDLAAGEARVAHGAAHHEAAGGVHVDLGVVGQRHALALEHRLHHVLDDLGAQLVVGDLLGMLRGHDHLLHPLRRASS